MQDLQGKTAVITGAASGIGLGVAHAFASEGMRLVLADIDADRLDHEATELRAGGADVRAVPTDVGDAGAVVRLARESYDHYGRVHVLLNNAGVIASGNCWELPLDDWERVLRVNLWGVIHGIRSFLPRMLDQGEEAHILNMGSMASVVPVPTIGPYNVAKHGLLALTEGLAAELSAIHRTDIGVTLVMPGRVASRLGGGEPDPSVMDPEALGAAVVDALRKRPLFCFTHAERIPEVVARFERIVGQDGTTSPA
ncbi:MAG: SDR family NAD(P)-dependent oxidoreductase [Actinobacteria bacterium]|nr:MAG: SDR family NAD(P)-dependent oxidoreductase [Actinomycetota bacterium]